MPERIQRKRNKGWRKPENTICVDRGTPWGNPFIIGKHVDNNSEAVEYFYAWVNSLCMPKKPGRDILLQLDGFESNLFKEAVKTNLRGKNLACYCKMTDPCHADVLLKIANEE